MSNNETQVLRARDSVAVGAVLAASEAAAEAFDRLAQAAATLMARMCRESRRRRTVRELQALSDHTLRDIGIARGEIHDAVNRLMDAR